MKTTALAVAFDPHIRVVEGSDLHREALPEFAAALAQALSRQRVRRAADQERYRAAVSCLLANVATVQIAVPGLALAVRRQARDGGRRSVDPPVYGCGLNAAVIAAERAGLFVPGHVGTNAVSVPTDKLLAMLPRPDASQIRTAGDQPAVILRGVKDRFGRAPNVPFDSRHVARELDEMATINAWLAKLQLEILDAPAWAVQTWHPLLVRVATLHHRACSRIFTGNRFDHGGRLYRPYWLGMKKADRFARLRLHGEPIGEVDFNAMFLRLAYRAAGAAWPFDDGEDGYTPANATHEQRAGYKSLTNAMLHGAKGRQFPADISARFPPGTKPTAVAAEIRARHSVLDGAGLLGSGIGHVLTRTESDLMVALLLRCRDLGLPALGVHDALLVPASRADQAREMMMGTAREKLGCVLPARVRSGV